jgi:hypothetical protein
VFTLSPEDTHVPVHLRETTSICLKATAGLRRLPRDEQSFLITAVHSHFQNSGYEFSHVHTSVIPGHEEALYDYMAVVVALEEGAVGAGVLDLGGASKQISYVIRPPAVAAVVVEVNVDGSSHTTGSDAVAADSGGSNECLPDYIIQLPGMAAPVGLVARSIQGMGLLAAMDFIVDLYVTHDPVEGIKIQPQPCMSAGETARGGYIVSNMQVMC